MKFTNAKMRALAVEIPSCLELPSNLVDVLNRGLDFVEDGVFFKIFNKNLKLPYPEFIKTSFTDLSGYENSINRFHIDDYCNHQLLEVSLLFMDEFLKMWTKCNSSSQCAAILNFQLDTEYGNLSSFTFHKYRDGEIVYELENLDKFEDPILIALSGC